MKYTTFILSVFALFLTACSTTIVEDSERELPDESEPAVVELENDIDSDTVDEEDEESQKDQESESQKDDADSEEVEDEDVEDTSDESNDVVEDETVTDVPDTEEEAMRTIGANLSRSLIAFVGSKGSITSHEGKFNDFDFSMNIPANGVTDFNNAEISVSIDINSMQTDSDGLTNHLKADDFFDAANHPTATFASTTVQQTEGSNYSVSGMLTIKGVSKPVTLDAVITGSYLTLSYNLDRTAFGVGGPAEGVKAIDAIVPVEVKIVFSS